MAEKIESNWLKLAVDLGEASFSAEGDADLVLKCFESFHERYGEGAPRQKRPKRAEPSAPTEPAEPPRSPATSPPTLSDEPLAAFMARNKRLKGNKEIAAAIVYWAKKAKEQKILSLKQIEDFWADTKHKLPKNPGRDVRNAAKEGWLKEADTRMFEITGYGEQFIEGRV